MQDFRYIVCRKCAFAFFIYNLKIFPYWSLIVSKMCVLVKVTANVI